jgi:nucleoside-diphosphate-sugar epimerase
MLSRHMRVLIIGGTGLISVGIIKHLQERGADVTMFNRAQRENTVVGKVKQLTGDRNEFDVFERRFSGEHFDVVIDMIGFSPAHAMSDVRAFSGKCTHFIFCSTVCSYGVKVPSYAVVDEQFAQEPISEYGRNKLACERIIQDAQKAGAFMSTVIRPSHTYGPGGPLIDQLEPNPVAWDRMKRGLPVLIAGDGLGLWNSTHRDDVGKLFAHAALNPVTYGKSYNATTQRIFTWRDYYREVADVLGVEARLLSMPADWIVNHDRKRFGLLAEITQYHGAYTSALAMADVPEFVCDIDFKTGVKQTFDDMTRRDAWKAGPDETYELMIGKATEAGVTPTPA